jgi:hypothetical protein
MPKRGAWLLALAVAVTAAACSSGGPQDDAVTLPIGDLPTLCDGVGEAPPEGEGQVTFVKGTLVFGVSPDGAGLHCIAGVAAVNPIAWGPQADFFVDVGFAASEVISDDDRVTIAGPGDTPRFQAISRPGGDRVLFIARDSTRLAKAPIDGGRLEDISFLRRHDEATYHPAGTQLAVLGETHDGIYGMWLVTNEGRERHLVVPTRDEDEFYGMSFSATGGHLYYLDDQHTTFELRVVDLATLEEGIALPESDLLLEEGEPISVMASPFSDDLIAYRVGSCDAGFETFVLRGDGPASGATEVGADLTETQPIGWLPDDRLVLAADDDLCDPQRTLDLHVVDPASETSVLLVEDVLQAAVRAVLPDADDPVSGPVGRIAE